MNLKEYLQPLIELYGIGTISKIVNRSRKTVYLWLDNGLPRSEDRGTTNYRAKLVGLAREHESTKHITIKGLAKYINNAKGE